MSAPGPAPVRIGADPVSLDEIVRIADGAGVVLEPAAVDRIRAGRAIVDAAVTGPDLVYGLNTGLGHLRNVRVDVDALRAYQVAIVVGHAGGIGPPLPTGIVRAAMAVRLVGIVRGGSGASVAVAEALAAALNGGVHPIVATTGSVGASDLMHMADIGLVLIGQGRAEFRGEIVPGGEALRRAGLAPVVLEPKDGLALVSANGVAVGRAALVVRRATAAAAAADLVGAVSLEAIGANPSILEPAVAVAKPVAGQADAAAHIRALLSGSERCRADAPRSVQDPLSFRVMPQVHGALRAFVDLAADAVATELAAMDDNPLVAIDEGRMISNGNFEPIVLALSMDALRPALAHVGQLADRRLGHLWTAVWASLETVDAEELERIGRDALGAVVRYAAATRAATLRGLAGPASLDIGPLDQSVEDHATNAPETAARTDEALDALEDILAIELLMAAGIIRRGSLASSLGRGTGAAFSRIDRLIDDAADRSSAEIVAEVRAWLGDLTRAADDAVGLGRGS